MGRGAVTSMNTVIKNTNMRINTTIRNIKISILADLLMENRQAMFITIPPIASTPTKNTIW
jgi:hypothetical protein